jgi:hypothetical protein
VASEYEQYVPVSLCSRVREGDLFCFLSVSQVQRLDVLQRGIPSPSIAIVGRQPGSEVLHASRNIDELQVIPRALVPDAEDALEIVTRGWELELDNLDLTKRSPASKPKSKSRGGLKSSPASGSGDCTACGGDGQVPCGSCGGTGEIVTQQGRFTSTTPCQACQQRGETSLDCQKCKGTGKKRGIDELE